MELPRPTPRDKFLSGLPAELRVTGVDVDATKELGRGSDATVFPGRWQGAAVAVKVLHESLVAPDVDPASRATLQRNFSEECKRLHGLRHPNVVQFFGACTHSGRPAMVTERIDSTLRSRYQRSPELTAFDEVRILSETASALAYIHSHDLVHRDLTTRNVLVTTDGRVKVADVGVARQMPESISGASAEAALTRAPGALLYMSPEAVSTTDDDDTVIYDQQMDVFSFGVLAAEVIARRDPSKDLLVTDRFQGPADCRHLVPEVERRRKDLEAVGQSHPLYPLIVQCLHNDPEQRPTSCVIRDRLAEQLLKMEKPPKPKSRRPSTQSASEPFLCSVWLSYL